MSIITNNLYSYMDESTVSQFLKCKICTKPFVDPVSTETGDRFCRACIVSILNRRPVRTISLEDPLTNTDSDQQAAKLQKLTPITEKLVLDMLDNILVRCIKCGLINIKRGELENHANTTCIQATVLCSAADIKCPWMGARGELEDHEEECKYQPLRSALEFVINENAQLKDRVEKLEAEVIELLATKGIQNFNLDS